MRKLKSLTVLMIALAITGTSCQKPQNSNKSDNKKKDVSAPKNIVLMIGDGMGVSQIYGGMTVSENPLVFEQFKNIGFQKTYSKDAYITDSGASGTAIATGKKTNNGHISVTPSGKKLTTILELAERNGLATGLASTSSILHATPAAFIAHNKDRGKYSDLATDFLETDIDVFIGGGKKYFANREDGKNLTAQLKSNNYQVLSDINKITQVKEGKLAGFTAKGHNPGYSDGRGDMLPKATQTALNILDNNQSGFFLMVEASQIDWGGHENNKEYIMEELLDFNRAVEKAMKFAKNNPETLVIVTGDHETGGMSLNGGDLQKDTIDAAFTTEGHTAEMLPVFAYGPGSEKFRGIYDNTDIFKKMKALYDFE